MTGTDLCVRLYKSVLVIFEPPCTKTWRLRSAGNEQWGQKLCQL